MRANEIELRTGQMSQKTGKQSLLLYKDARCDMAMLDEAVGAMNWKREHTRDNANCIVSIWDSVKNIWVSKEDTGTESKTEAEKGLASDSFKRACFNWGIGRELYTAPQIWVSGDLNPRNLHISRIEYNKDREIVALDIRNEKGDIVWSMGAKTVTAPSATPQPEPSISFDPVELTEREREEFDAACAYMDAAETKDDLNGLWSRYKEARFAPLLKEHGYKVKKEKGW